MTHGDYSMRGRKSISDDSLGQLVGQINNLADTLTKQRFTAMESQLLVDKVIQQIDVAIIAVDEKDHIALINRAAEKLLNVTQNQVINKPLQKIGVEQLLNVTSKQVLPLSFAQGKGEFQIIRDQYREGGHQHQLFFITNVHHLLREHERQAWKNLIRVLSHEINNSLAPISSLSNTLQGLSKKQGLPDDFSEILISSLAIISERANSLTLFVDSYRQLNHLPKPQKQPIDIEPLFNKIIPLFIDRVIKMENDLIQPLLIDEVQFEQVLINLIKNADEATDDKTQPIMIKAYSKQALTYIDIIDQGIGIQNIDNIFTPFYTTKKQGSGIGLVLCRQIIEAHQGHLSINNNENSRGCIVKIMLPN